VEIGRLAGLTWLRLDNNQLSSLPVEIVRLT
jgi:Leucine-rich repeat (LRR) protein